METSDSSTSSYTLEHINQVKSKMEFFASVLATRGTSHDSSKLIEPEYSGWLAMDQEPRYPYGSEKYYDKINRFEACSTLKMWNIPELFTIAENLLLLVPLFVLPLLTSKACRLLDFSFQKKQDGNSAC